MDASPSRSSIPQLWVSFFRTRTFVYLPFRRVYQTELSIPNSNTRHLTETDILERSGVAGRNVAPLSIVKSTLDLLLQVTLAYRLRARRGRDYG